MKINILNKRLGFVAHLGECLSQMYKALSLISSTQTHKNSCTLARIDGICLESQQFWAEAGG